MRGGPTQGRLHELPALLGADDASPARRFPFKICLVIWRNRRRLGSTL